MTDVVSYAFETYLSNIKLILLFSIAFVIAFLIPLFASFPTFNDAGAILIRTSSIFLNLNIFNTAVIVVSVFFSLLFLSFAIVAINVVVRHSRTHTKIKKEVIDGLEKHTGKVFAVLLFWLVVVILTNVLSFGTRYSAVVTAVAGLLLTPITFYAPASIVIDENRIDRAMRASFKFFFERFDYFVLWIVMAIVLITVFDFLFVTLTSTIHSRYYMLFFNSLFILPFLVVLQSEFYMKRFKLLKR